MGQGVRGYLTVYLAMTLGVMVSLSFVLIQGVRQSTLRLEALCVSEIAVDNVMAEYHRELFRRFGILALDSSYGGKTMGWDNTQERLALYLDKNIVQERDNASLFPSSLFFGNMVPIGILDTELIEASLLTDDEGAVFRSQAIRVMEDDMGVGTLQELIKWMETVEEFQLDTRDIQGEKQAADDRIEKIREELQEIQESEGAMEVFENPTLEIERQRKKGILKQTVSGEVSGKQLNSMSLIYQRMKDGRINRGNAPRESYSKTTEMVRRGMFQEYLLKYLGHYTNVQADSALNYGVEYVLMGREKDVDNLRGVFQRVTAMREAANAAYLYQDSTKKQQADIAAWVIALMAGSPEMQEALSTTIILGWAYAESVYDMKQLAAGGRVPLMKDKDSWHYNLEGALQFWNEEPVVQGEGLAYEDYLRILLSLADLEQMTGRAMNLVEADIRMTEGNSRFRLDGCYESFQVVIYLRGVKGYDMEIMQSGTY